MTKWISSEIQSAINEGHDPYLLTFMFNPIGGGDQHRHRIMMQQVRKFYGSLLTRTIRPNRSGTVPPILWATSDWQVWKKKSSSKSSITDAKVNDGHHVHGILLMPPARQKIRFTVPLEQHLLDNDDVYRRDSLIRTIHCEPITETPAKATDYAFKGFWTNRISTDDNLLMLPETGFRAGTY